MPRIAPSTLLKLMSQRSEDKIRDLRVYDEPGGYDVHKSFRLAVRRGLLRDGLAGMLAAIDEIGVPQERSRAKGFAPIVARKLRSLGTRFIVPPRSVWRSPQRMFTVEFHPEIGIQQGNHQLFLQLYVNQKVKPSPTSAGALILLARASLASQLGEMDAVGVFDVARNTIFRSVNNTSLELLNKEIVDMDRWFADRAR